MYCICFVVALCRYAEAVLSCVQQLGLLMSGQQPEPGGVDEEDGLGIFLFFLVGVIAVGGWAWHSDRKRSKRYKVGLLQVAMFSSSFGLAAQF